MQGLILVVDHEPKIGRHARDYLEERGFHVLPASDGQTALALPRQGCPALILLDLNLPGTDNLEVCWALRRIGDHWADSPSAEVTSHRIAA